MQEILPLTIQPTPYPDIRAVGRGVKQLFVTIWKSIGWMLEVLFTPPPGQRYIEEQRLRAMRLTGHF